jgi:hypothetical protein
MGERLECGVDRRPVEIVRDAFPNKQRSCTRRITVFDQTMLDEDRCGMLFSRLHRSLTIARRACAEPDGDPSLSRRRATQRYPRTSDATAPVKGPYVACALPAQTSKFIADSIKTKLQMFRGEQTTSF